MTIKYVYVACVPIKKANEEILCGPKEQLHIQGLSYTKTAVQLALLQAVDLLQSVLHGLEGEQESRQPKKVSLAIFSELLTIWFYVSPYFYLYARHSTLRTGKVRKAPPALTSQLLSKLDFQKL